MIWRLRREDRVVMRAFVAIEISEEMRDALGALIAELRRHGGAVKWVAPENLHLTLKFLGSVGDDAMPAVVEILRDCADGIAPFRLEVKGTGAFPNLRRPRVVYADAEDSPRLAGELARRLNRRMTRVGVEREDRPFRRHITLGRIRKPGPIGEAGKRLAELADRSFGSMKVQRMVLMKSDLTPDGPVYTPIEHVALMAAEGGQGVTEENNQESS